MGIFAIDRFWEYVSFTRGVLCNILIQFSVRAWAPTLSSVHCVQLFVYYIHWLLGNRAGSLAFPRVARNFLTRRMTEFRKDHSNTPREELRFSRFCFMLRCGRCGRCFAWWFLGNLSALLRKCFVSCSPLLILPPLVWIISYIVGHVTLFYENHPLSTSGIHVIVKAIFWVPCRISRRFFLIAFQGVIWQDIYQIKTASSVSLPNLLLV
jgi:hypothetical protein